MTMRDAKHDDEHATKAPTDVDLPWRVRTPSLKNVDHQLGLILIHHEPCEVPVHPAMLTAPIRFAEGVG